MVYKRIIQVLFFLLCLGTLFLSTSSFVNAQVAPKWYSCIFGSALLLLTLFIYVTSPEYTKIQWDKLNLSFIIAISCTIQALYGIAQYMKMFPAAGVHKVTGSFDNPAGFAACLCAGFPFFFYFLGKKELWIRSLTIVGMAIVGLSVALSGSRAGLLGLLAVCIAGFFKLLRISTKQKTVIGILLTVLAIGLYFTKKDSADGRLLIWRCSWEMIKEKPVTGFGYGGFKANYMNYQAKYFEKHPDSKYALLADNMNRPFNEYVELLVDYGLAGMIVFLLCALCVFFVYFAVNRKRKNYQTHIAFCCLIGIAVFAFFSYPLRYPFVWVAGLLSVSIIVFQSLSPPRAGSWNLFKKACLPAAILILAPVVCIKSYIRLMADVKWCKVAHLSLAGETEQMLPEYQNLYTKLYNNELFLYNYAAELNFVKHYEQSQSIALECERLWADYDLQMLMADNCQQLKDYTGAEQRYRKAAAMCPVKFMPLYELAKMFDVIGCRNEAIALAQQIVNKPIKIASPDIAAIQREMRQLIDEEQKSQNNARQGKEAASSTTMFYHKGHKAFSQKTQNYYCHCGLDPQSSVSLWGTGFRLDDSYCVLCASLVHFVVKNSFDTASALPP